MSDLRLKISSRPKEVLPVDLSVGEHLAELVVTASRKGRGLPGVGVVVRAGSLDLVELGEPMRAGLPLGGLLAGLSATRTERGGAVTAVGLIGGFKRRGRTDKEGRRVAMVFLEWPDCRWWHWVAELDAMGIVRPDTAQVRSAVEGDPLPGGLGRWWTQARLRRLRVALLVEAVPEAAPPQVH
jgi:hypothetical protein